MSRPDDPALPLAPEPIRLRTMVLLRWVAVAGQVASVAVAVALGVRLPLGPVLAVIALSAAANLAMQSGRPIRPDGREASWHLAFDLVQVTVLIALTGGLSNPFAMLVIAPATIAATALSWRAAAVLTAASVALVTAAGLVAAPLPLRDGTPLAVPALFAAGHWVAIVVTLVFVVCYAHRVARELRATGLALAATELALEREQRLQHLGGVIAAAAHALGTPLGTIKLVAGELRETLSDRPDVASDLALLRDSADRCRDILQGMGRSGRDDLLLHHAPLTGLISEAAEPHLRRRRIDVVTEGEADSEPVLRRDPGVIHALRNVIQNAADHASGTVRITARWDRARVEIAVEDDGPGFPPALLARIGDPFVRGSPGSAPRGDGSEGMGLGLYIARSLLSRSGASIAFSNLEGRSGARVAIVWPRGRIEAPEAARAALAENPLIER